MRMTLTVLAEIATIVAVVITVGQMLGWWQVPIG